MPDVHDKYEHLNEPLLEFLTINLLTVTNTSERNEMKQLLVRFFLRRYGLPKTLGLYVDQFKWCCLSKNLVFNTLSAGSDKDPGHQRQT